MKARTKHGTHNDVDKHGLDVRARKRLGIKDRIDKVKPTMPKNNGQGYDRGAAMEDNDFESSSDLIDRRFGEVLDGVLGEASAKSPKVKRDKETGFPLIDPKDVEKAIHDAAKEYSVGVVKIEVFPPRKPSKGVLAGKDFGFVVIADISKMKEIPNQYSSDQSDLFGYAMVDRIQRDVFANKQRVEHAVMVLPPARNPEKYAHYRIKTPLYVATFDR